MPEASSPWIELYRTADLETVMPAVPALRRATRANQLVRLRRGVFADAVSYQLLDARERHVVLARATMLELPSAPVLSHYAAAAFLGLPHIGAWPMDVHVTVERATGGRSDPGIRRHAVGIRADDVATVEGLAITTLARTLVDLAATAPLYSAIAMLDSALMAPRFGPPARIAKDTLYGQWESMLPFRGFARARRLIDFSTPLAESTSESTSRVSMALLGFPAPILQKAWIIDGRDVFTDFFWEEVNGIGECDGKGKYLDPALRAGRSAEEVLLDERRRENELRRQVKGFQRWDSAEAMTPSRLRVKLLELGLRQGGARLRGR